MIDLADWNERRLAVHTSFAATEHRVVGFSDVTDGGLLDMLFGRPGLAAVESPRLVGAVIQRARELGLSRVDTHASRTARPVFERFGFQVDRSNTDNWIRGENLPNYDMHLDLN